MRSNIKYGIFLILGLIALFTTWPHAFDWMRNGGNILDPTAFFGDAIKAGGTAAFLSIDMLIAWVVFMIWVVFDAKRIGMGAKWGWFFVALSYIGVSFTFPVYLIARERFLDRKLKADALPVAGCSLDVLGMERIGSLLQKPVATCRLSPLGSAGIVFPHGFVSVKNTERSAAVGLAGLLASFCAQASLGIYEQGNGIKAMGMGGVSYVGVDESTVLSANPALAISQGSRFDLGNDLLIVSGGTRIRGNAAGPDEYYDSSGKSLFPIPQFGFTIPIAERWAFGAAAFAAGLGPDYPRSPYARFAQGQGADVEARSVTALNTLKVAGLSLALAHEIIPGQSIGLSANLQHTSISTEGTAPFASMSVAPDFVGNQGQHGSFGVSFTAGWTGTITPWLSGGLSYRSKAWQQRIEQYRGLLPDGGRLELPAIFGGALEARPSESWRLAVEYQHYAYSGSNGFGNTIDLLFAGVPLGAKDGPGFGWRDQNVYKFGFQYLATPQVTLRAGVSYATSLLPRSQTLFNGLAPATPQWNLGVGGTLGLTTNSEISFVMATTEHNTVRGKDSIPDAFGGGEADVDFKCFNIGISYGKRFGKSRAGARS